MPKLIKRKPLIPELTGDEKDYLLPLLIKYFKKETSKYNPKTQPQIEKFFRDRADRLPMFGDNPLPLARMMKLVQYIRGKELLPIASGGNGYWVTTDPDDLDATIDNFQSRIDSFQATMNGLKNMKSLMLIGYVKIPQLKDEENTHKKIESKMKSAGFNFKERNEDKKDDIFDNLDQWNLNLYK